MEGKKKGEREKGSERGKVEGGKREREEGGLTVVQDSPVSDAPGRQTQHRLSADRPSSHPDLKKEPGASRGSVVFRESDWRRGERGRVRWTRL